MAHSYSNCLVHCVFSTKNRQRLITPKIEERLWPYLGGIAREHKMVALAIGGIADHVHLLLSIPAVLSISKALQLIKGGSSKWVHETFPEQRDFAWQEGFGAFSISISGVEDTVQYINDQKERHRKVTYQEEYISFLKKHKIEYNEAYVWG